MTEAERTHDVPRGICPRCGSDDVRHLAIGMPAGPEVTSGTPPWVSWVGCVHPGHDRECDACGEAWSASNYAG